MSKDKKNCRPMVSSGSLAKRSESKIRWAVLALNCILMNGDYSCDELSAAFKPQVRLCIVQIQLYHFLYVLLLLSFRIICKIPQILNITTTYCTRYQQQSISFYHFALALCFINIVRVNVFWSLLVLCFLDTSSIPLDYACRHGISSSWDDSSFGWGMEVLLW